MNESTEPAVMAASAERRAEYITGLRELVDWLEANPDVPMDLVRPSFQVSVSDGDDKAGLAEVDRIAALIGACTEPRAGTFVAERTFTGGVRYFVVYHLADDWRAWEDRQSYSGNVQTGGAK